VLPSRYTLYPTSVLRMSEVPIHLRWTYLVLYALAWVHDYQWLDQTHQQLSQTFTALEGEEISPRGIRQRLTDLAGHGLIERRQVGGRYRTYLMVRHDKGDAPSVTSEARGDAQQRHPIKNNYVVDGIDVSDSPEQQQHNIKQGDVDEICALLEGIGVWGNVARRLAEQEHVSLEYVEQIIAHRAREAGRGNNLGVPWVVKMIGEGWQPPQEVPDRYRYVHGKYAEYVKR